MSQSNTLTLELIKAQAIPGLVEMKKGACFSGRAFSQPGKYAWVIEVPRTGSLTTTLFGAPITLSPTQAVFLLADEAKQV